MPKIDFTNVEESSGGSFKRLVPGTYVCRIIDAQLFEDKQYMRIEWDVAAGEYEGIFKDAPFAVYDYLSYKQSSLGMLKHKLSCITESNSGFDAESAFQRDDMASFRGKVFGARVRKRLYTKNDGTDGEGFEIGQWLRSHEALTGTYDIMEPRDQRDVSRRAMTASVTPASTANGVADVYDEDIPF